MRILYDKFADRCRRDPELLKMGATALLTCTYRSNEEQARLYAQGRTAPGHTVTKAKPGKSRHNVTTPQGKPAAEAFDIVPLVDGKAVWDARHPAWALIGAHGEAVGLQWFGSDDSTYYELPHFQVRT